MKFKATPLAMTDAFWRKSLEESPLDCDIPGSASDYEERQTIEVEADNITAVLNKTWQAFQNIDDDWHCPDNKRSLMVGDLIMVERVDAGGSWLSCHRVAICGFTEVKAPLTA